MYSTINSIKPGVYFLYIVWYYVVLYSIVYRTIIALYSITYFYYI